jgi:RP/EB family microtubule-associated protein
LLDLAFPDTKIPLSKLNWAAKQECEILTNLRLLNSWMERLKVGRVLDVLPSLIQIDKIAKCKYQDNLETIQWFKRYIDMHVK